MINFVNDFIFSRSNGLKFFFFSKKYFLEKKKKENKIFNE